MLLKLLKTGKERSHAKNIPRQPIHLLKGDHVTQRAGVWMAERIMLKWPVSIDPTLKTYRQEVSAGDLPSLHWGSVRLCEAEGLPAESLSGFLHPLQRVTSPGPSHHHMDHLNDLSTGSVEADESTQKQRKGQRLCNHLDCLRFSSYKEGMSASFIWILIKLPGERARDRIFTEQVYGCFLVGIAQCAVLYTFLKPFLSNMFCSLKAELHMHFN